MTFINLAPDPKGVENIAQRFREGIAESLRKAKMAEELADNGLDRYDIYQPDLGLIEEGLYMVADRCERSAAEMSDALAECELAIEANRVLALLRKGQEYLPKNYPSSVDDVIAIIVELAGKAGMKG